MNYTDIISKWKEKKIDSIEKLDQQLSNFRITFAYNSGTIENPQITYHATREVFENGKVINFCGDTQTIFEIENQKIISLEGLFTVDYLTSKKML